MFSSLWNAGNIIGSAILYCITSSNSPSCDYSDPDYITYQEIGGTSAASPYMAGVMALVMQKTGTKQGLANPTLYKLAAKDNLTSCKSSAVSVTGSNSCVFYDVTSGTIAQACYSGDPNCTTHTAGDEYGIQSGYSATTGYDRATGLGSVNVTNLVNEWASVAASPAATLSPSALSFASTKVGSVSAAQTVTVKNTGGTALSLTSGGITFTGTDASSFARTATTCGNVRSGGKTERDVRGVRQPKVRLRLDGQEHHAHQQRHRIVDPHVDHPDRHRGQQLLVDQDMWLDPGQRRELYADRHVQTRVEGSEVRDARRGRQRLGIAAEGRRRRNG